MQRSKLCTCTLIGEDTDLLISISVPCWRTNNCITAQVYNHAMKPYIIIYHTEQTRNWTVSTFVAPACIYWVGYNLTDISHRKKKQVFPKLHTDTMKAVGNSTTRDITPSEYRNDKPTLSSMIQHTCELACPRTLYQQTNFHQQLSRR